MLQYPEQLEGGVAMREWTHKDLSNTMKTSTRTSPGLNPNAIDARGKQLHDFVRYLSSHKQPLWPSNTGRVGLYIVNAALNTGRKGTRVQSRLLLLVVKPTSQ